MTSRHRAGELRVEHDGQRTELGVGHFEFFVPFLIGDDGGDAGFVAAAGGGGHSKKGWQAVRQPKEAGHALDGFVVGDFGRSDLGAVDGGAAAEGHDAVTEMGLIHFDGGVSTKIGRASCRERV